MNSKHAIVVKFMDTLSLGVQLTRRQACDRTKRELSAKGHVVHEINACDAFAIELVTYIASQIHGHGVPWGSF